MKPTAVTYTNAISACKRAAEPDLETALYLLESAPLDGVEPNVFMYTAVIWTAARKGDGEVALSILERMKAAKGCTPTAITYDGGKVLNHSLAGSAYLFKISHLCNHFSHPVSYYLLSISRKDHAYF